MPENNNIPTFKPGDRVKGTWRNPDNLEGDYLVVTGTVKSVNDNGSCQEIWVDDDPDVTEKGPDSREAFFELDESLWIIPNPENPYETLELIES